MELFFFFFWGGGGRGRRLALWCNVSEGGEAEEGFFFKGYLIMAVFFYIKC